MTLSLNEQGFPTWQGSEISLPPKEKSILRLLIQRYPDPVHKGEIIDQIWPQDRLVSDDSIVRCISQIRKYLPDISIESIYGFGYRLQPGSVIQYCSLREVVNAPSAAVQAYLYAVGLTQERTAIHVHQAISVFRSAIETYPTYIPVRIGLAQAIVNAISIGIDREIGVSADEAWGLISSITELSPDAYGLCATQAALYDVTWRFNKASELFANSLAHEPDNADLLLMFVWHLIAIGRQSEAIEVLRKILRIRPFSTYVRIVLARTLSCVGDVEAAFREISHAESCAPDGHPLIASTKIMVAAMHGPNESLIAPARDLHKVRALPPNARVNLPYVLARCGHLDEARHEIELLAESKAGSVTGNILLAQAYIAIGENQKAIDAIEEAFHARHGWLPIIFHCPDFYVLFENPMMKKIRSAIFSSIDK